jgi:hypothetical protein
MPSLSGVPYPGGGVLQLISRATTPFTGNGRPRCRPGVAGNGISHYRFCNAVTSRCKHYIMRAQYDMEHLRVVGQSSNFQADAGRPAGTVVDRRTMGRVGRTSGCPDWDCAPRANANRLVTALDPSALHRGFHGRQRGSNEACFVPRRFGTCKVGKCTGRDPAGTLLPVIALA